MSRSGLLSTSALLGVMAVSSVVKLGQPAWQFPYWYSVMALWIVAVAAYALAWHEPKRLWERLRLGITRAPLEALLVTVLVGGALAIRMVALADYPRVVGGDDGQAGLLARQILHGGPGSPFASRFFGLAYHPALWFYGVAAGMLVFGDDVAGSRAFAAFVGTAAVALTYRAARSWFGPRVAFLSAGFLAVFPYHVHWSRSQLNGVGDTLGIVAVLWTLLRALEQPSRGRYALAGLALGLSQYSYQGARVLLVLVPLLIIREVATGQMRKRDLLSALATLAGGFLTAFLPMIAYYVDHPREYVGRAAQVSIFTSGWLAAEAPRRGTSELAVIADQLRRSFLVFFTEPPHAFYAPGRALLEPPGAACMLVGVGAALLGIRRRGPFALLFSLVAIVSLQALTVDVPASARLIIVSPLVAVFVGLGLDTLAQLLSFGSHLRATLIGILGIIVLGATSLRFYFFQYAPVHERGAAPQTELAYLMRTYPAGTRFLLFTLPQFSCTTHATIGFIAPDQTCEDMVDGESRSTGARARDGDVVVAVAGQRALAEEVVSQQLPNVWQPSAELLPGSELYVWPTVAQDQPR